MPSLFRKPHAQVAPELARPMLAKLAVTQPQLLNHSSSTNSFRSMATSDVSLIAKRLRQIETVQVRRKRSLNTNDTRYVVEVYRHDKHAWEPTESALCTEEVRQQLLREREPDYESQAHEFAAITALRDALCDACASCSGCTVCAQLQALIASGLNQPKSFHQMLPTTCATTLTLYLNQILCVVNASEGPMKACAMLTKALTEVDAFVRRSHQRDLGLL